MFLVELPLLHLPDGRLSRPHQLLLLLKELSVQEGDLLFVRVTQASQGCLVTLAQLGQEILLLKEIDCMVQNRYYF